MSKDFGSLVEDIRQRAELLAELLRNVSLDAFKSDIKLMLATERLFIIIGEAGYKLPRLERGQFRNVPWKQIAGLMHRLVHDYGETRHDLLYEFAVSNVPHLIAELDWRRPASSDFPCPIKVCGVTTPDIMAAALDAGVDMVGLNFHPKSPRRVSFQTAAALAAQARGRALVVALAVDPTEDMLDEIIGAAQPDLLQLHGSETSEQLDEITARRELPVMKALGVAETADLTTVARFRSHVDRLLLDAKPPKDAAYPGGHGKTFDWSVLKALDPFMPFMLSGGLTPENVGDAIRTVRALGVTLGGVDVASGVESAPGVKDASKIRAFVENARKAAQ